jgi:L-alanine-DL-glutamate epimerase-like enolase superfamily enzyme
VLTAVDAEISGIAIPFRFGFRHSLAERDVGDGVLLAVRDAEGRRGYGECTPREYVSGETSRSVVDVLSRRVQRLLGHGFASFEELTAELAREADGLPRAEHAAFCALEVAWLDLGGQVFGRSAGEPLGPVCTPRVEYSAVVSASGSAEAAKTCQAIRELGVTRVKVKVGGERAADLEVLGAVRDALGDEAHLRVDANGAWDAETALARLRDFESFRLEGCEQPCAADDLDGMAWLTARSTVPVIADESLVSIEDARRLIELRACHVFNVRISKCGGLLGAGRIRELGRAAGIDSMLGAHVGETAILAAAGRHFAARTPGLRFAEGSYGKILLKADVSDAMDLGRGGAGAVISGDGLGVDVDLERIAEYVVSSTKLTA